jgi:hypothetical protein
VTALRAIHTTPRPLKRPSWRGGTGDSYGRSPDGKDVWLNWVVREQRTGQIVGTMQATIGVEQTSRIAVLVVVPGGPARADEDGG